MHGNFLLYKEVNPQPPSGRSRKHDRPVSQRSRRAPPDTDSFGGSTPFFIEGSSPMSMVEQPYQQSSFEDVSPGERQLFGSLIDTSMHDFKEDGLMKKTTSVMIGQRRYALVSYYLPADVGALCRPSCFGALRIVQPRMELLQNQLLRRPLDQEEDTICDIQSDVLLHDHLSMRHQITPSTTPCFNNNCYGRTMQGNHAFQDQNNLCSNDPITQPTTWEQDMPFCAPTNLAGNIPTMACWPQIPSTTI